LARITSERAERIAKSHACEHCGEYSYKKLVVKPASRELQKELKEAWHVTKICGVCGTQHEMGLDAEGEIVYVT
jgi:transcription elongation factor Elf1